MDKRYKAIVFTSPINPKKAEIRYAIKDTESGSIVDDAQGYGYKSAQRAYAGWAYKNRDKARDIEKVRFAFPGSGKSGSVRVCYIDIEGVLEIHLIDVFAKNEKENLSKAERNAIRIVVEQIKAERLKAKR